MSSTSSLDDIVLASLTKDKTTNGSDDSILSPLNTDKKQVEPSGNASYSDSGKVKSCKNSICSDGDAKLLSSLNFQQKRCLRKACRSNTTKNLLCFCKLGTSNWKGANADKAESIKSKKLKEIESRSNKNRADFPVGLKNLGSTCFANSMLQVWFHNPRFRNAVYTYKINEILYPQLYKINSAIKNLFTLMNSRATDSVNTRNLLVNILNYDVDIENDAHEMHLNVLQNFNACPEFQKFMDVEYYFEKESLITNNCCPNHPRPSPTSKQNFIGFYPTLEHSHLEDLLQSVVFEERSDVKCPQCLNTSDATVTSKLKDLPNTLTFNLSRHSIENTGKKNTHPVHFPFRLDLSEYVSNQENVEPYELSAIVVHKGRQTNTGHFLTLIRTDEFSKVSVSNNSKSPKTKNKNNPLGDFYVFNDEEVGIYSFDNLIVEHLTNTSLKKFDEVVSKLQPMKNSTRSKSNLTNIARDVVILVYTKKSEVVYTLPEDIKSTIAECKLKYEKELWKADLSDKAKAGKEFEKMCLAAKFLDSLENEGNMFFVPSSAIQHYLMKKPKKSPDGGKSDNSDENKENKSQKLSFILQKDVACDHNMLSPYSLTKLKKVNEDCKNILLKEYPQMCVFLCSDNNVCTKCSNSFLSFKKNSEKGLYSKHKLCELITTIKKDAQESSLKEKDKFIVYWNDIKSLSKKIDDYLNLSEPHIALNKELKCPCNKIIPDHSKYKAVSAEAYKKLVKYFTKVCFEVKESEIHTYFCNVCTSAFTDNQQVNSHLREKVTNASNKLSKLIQSSKRDRPDSFFLATKSINKLISSKFYIVPRSFVKDLRQLCKDLNLNKIKSFLKSKNVSLKDHIENGAGLEVKNSVYLCQEHKMFWNNPVRMVQRSCTGRKKQEEGELEPCSLLWEEEWKFVKENFKFDYELMVKKNNSEVCKVSVVDILKSKGGDTIDNSKPKLSSESSKLDLDEDHDIFDAVSSPSICKICCSTEAKTLKIVKNDNPEVLVVYFDEHGTPGHYLNYEEQPPKRAKIQRNSKNERKISNFNPSMSLSELKLALINEFSLHFFTLSDLHLYQEPFFTEVSGDNSTIGSLGVTFENKLVLVAYNSFD